MNQCLITPDRELMTDLEDTIKVQLGETVSFIGVACRNTGERILTGTQKTEEQLHYQSMCDSSQKGETGSTLHSLQRAQDVGECPFSRLFSWPVPLPDNSPGFCFFQFFGRSLLLPVVWGCLRVFFAALLFVCRERRKLVNLVTFNGMVSLRDFLKLFWVQEIPVVVSFPLL